MDRSFLLFSYWLLNLAVASIAVAVLLHNRRQQGIWASALLLFLGHFWIYFAIVPLLQITVGEYGPYHTSDPTVAFTLAWAESTGFLVAALLAYIAVRKAGFGPVARPMGPRRLSNLFYAAVTTVFLGVYAVSYSRFFDQGLGYYLANLGNRIQLGLGKGYWLWGMSLSLAAALYYVDRVLAGSKRRADLAFGAFWTAVAIATQAVLALRGRTFFLVIILLLLGAYRRRASLRRSALVAGALLTAGLLWGAVRHSLFSDGRQASDLSLQSIGENARVSLGVAETAGILANKVRSEDYEYGATFLAAVTMPIPRALWPGKPNGSGPAASNIISPGIYQLGGENSTGITISLLGEAWYNFGPLGIPIVGVLYGLGLALVDRRLGRLLHQPSDMRIGPWVTAAYLGTMSVLVGEFAGAVIGAAMIVLPYRALVWLERRPTSRSNVKQRYRSYAVRHDIESNAQRRVI